MAQANNPPDCRPWRLTKVAIAYLVIEFLHAAFYILRLGGEKWAGSRA